VALLVVAGCTKSAPPLIETAEAARTVTVEKAVVPAVAIDLDRYERALAEGRRLHRAREYAAAVKAFEGALAAAPDDARAQSELGWAAFFAGDLGRAEQATRRALAGTDDAELRGSALYNLGRILEARGAADEAIDAYARSMEARPNAIVAERRTKLGEAAALVAATTEPRPLSGPHTDLAAWCSERERASAEGFLCDPTSKQLGYYDGARSLERPPAPFLEVRVFASGTAMFPGDESSEIGFGEASYHLAVRTDRGWFVWQDLASTYNPGAFGIWGEMRTDALELRDLVPGGAPEVVVRYTSSLVDQNMAGAEVSFESTSYVLVCGIGSSGPSCVGPVATSHENGVDYTLWEEHQAELGPPPGKSTSGGWSIETKEPGDGTLVLGPARVQGSLHAVPVEVAALLGTHALSLP
jgi:tetratricopeptide (TPR) repeat protein